jgi:beta-lactamase superfamily II metal-dependent hydrolase
MVYITEDIVRFRPRVGASFNLYWGEKIEVLGRENGRTKVRVFERGASPIDGTVAGRLPTQEKAPLQFMMVDVQQGDGMIMITPAGKKIFIDGGDNKLFARFAAARFRGTSADNPLDVDAMIVTHGDADHFDGLNKIRASETHKTLRKRLFLRPLRVYHNGLVKGPSSLDDVKMFGATVDTRKGPVIVDLVDEVTSVPASRLNRPFKSWITSLKHWAKRGPIDQKRLAFGNKREFAFLRPEGIEVEVLGPIETRVRRGGRSRAGLRFLNTPAKDANISVTGSDAARKRPSASHTVNGHSVTLRVNYGNVRFFLSGDLNQQSMDALRAKTTPSQLKSEILKVPHHGSADFDLGLLKEVSPVISLISSGDESSRKEHIHPRATLMGALGKVARNDVSLVFCTELAAFFEMRGMSQTLDAKKKRYFGFERTNFGIIHIRTDGERVLVFTHSGKAGMNEAYRLTVDKQHRVKLAKNIKKR